MRNRTHLSRREFAALAASAAAAPFAFGRSLSGAAAVTAQDVIDLVRKNVGVAWEADTVDTIKAGDPAVVVRGIATTSMATLDVLQRAVDANANLVVTLEPTFFSRGDARTPPAGRGRGGRGARGSAPPGPPPPPPPADPVFTAKNDVIARHNLVVWRFSDHWRRRKPDPLAQGLGEALGWASYATLGSPARYEIPAVRLDSLARRVKEALNARGGMRIVGDPQTEVRTVALLPGSTPIAASLQALPMADAVIAGEVREWESVEYARDVVFSGQKKGLILVGRIVSVEPSMKVCADWLRTFVPDVPVHHLPAGDPYWRPVA